MNKKILITGVSGFVGGYLLDFLKKDKNNIFFGTYYFDKDTEYLKDKVRLTKIDLKNEKEVDGLMAEVKPDFVYHLAAFTSPKDSFSSPNETVLNNISSQINILEAVKNHNLKKTKILVVSSAEVYGNVGKKDLPIDEKTDFNPTNPYAVSKLAQDFLGRQYFLAYGLKIIRVRPFNHIGPGQSPKFAVAAFARKIAEIEKGKRPPVVSVGNLEAKRDFTDVRDVVRAYALLMDKGKEGEVYNIGSGTSHKMLDILNKLISFSNVKVKVETDKSLFRPADNPNLVCDPDKIHNATGWTPEILLGKTLKDTLDYWRDII